MSFDPATIAKGLFTSLVVGAAALLCVHVLVNEPNNELLIALIIVPWIVAPTGVAALSAVYFGKSAKGWSFVGAEAVAALSTAWLWVMLVLIVPDPINAITMMLFPFFQFAVLFVYAGAVFAFAFVLRRTRFRRA